LAMPRLCAIGKPAARHGTNRPYRMYLRRTSGTNRPSVGVIASLILLAGMVQVWLVLRAVVPAQDSIRYLTVAQSIARDGWFAALREQPEQPLFPSLVYLTHSLLAHKLGDFAGDWCLSLQLAAAAPLALSVAPVYLLFERLHGRRAALLAAVLFCVLGGIARLGADGLSDSTHLLFFCVALWAAGEFFVQLDAGRLSVAWLLASGFSTGLALLARAEAVVLPLALLIALAAFQGARRRRQAWSATLQSVGALMLGLAPPCCAYLAICQVHDIETAASRLLGRRGAIESLPLNDLSPPDGIAPAEAKWHVPGVGQLVFGKKDVSTSSRFRGCLSATAKLVEELAQTLHYGLGALAIAGLWLWRRRLHTPLDRFMQLLCAALLLASLSVAARSGYLSTRHLLLLVVLALGWAAMGALAIGDWLVEFYRGHSLNVKADRKMVTCSLVFLALANCMGDLLRPLHASRAAHREAAEWLKAHAAVRDVVLDSRGWTALYTGRKTYRYEAAQAAFSDPALAYVVVEQTELEASSRRGETLRLLVAQAGEPAARFAPAGAAKHGVTVWRWHPQQFAQLGVVSDAR
ncbi:MAG TPA: glycosyltransferase family 39 protein, partial [Pirellulales bacterium]|nr:glycosyltransferase family 39 protein [Pirellulales bacterium]